MGREFEELTAFKLPCLASAASAVGCAGQFDIQCQCQNAEQVQDLASSCVVGSCGAESAKIVQSLGYAICNQCVAAATPTAQMH